MDQNVLTESLKKLFSVFSITPVVARSVIQLLTCRGSCHSIILQKKRRMLLCHEIMSSFASLNSLRLDRTTSTSAQMSQSRPKSHLDPDQFTDSLPQPYRMIVKIIEVITHSYHLSILPSLHPYLLFMTPSLYHTFSLSYVLSIIMKAIQLLIY
jgi:hypothetical protein